ncbi:MAG TPA: FixH family protein [Polyangiaceae bacterium]
MNTVTESAPELSKSRRGTFWALLPVVLLVSSLTGVLVMASIARSDPSFALESDYYQRAVRWDGQQLEWAENARLGYTIEAESVATSEGVELRATLRDRNGAKLEGASVGVEAFANARAADVRRLTLRESEAGAYAVGLGQPRPGLWEFRFSVVRDGKRFTQIVRADVPRRQAAP